MHNLATFLNPRRTQVAALGKAAVVVKGCDAKAVAGLLREAQFERDAVVLIGVRCGGVVGSPAAPEAPALTAETVAARCFACDVREPASVDVLVGDAQPEPPGAGTPRRAHRRARRAEPRRALRLLDQRALALHPVLRLPPGLPAVLLRALHRRKDRAAVDRDLAAPARQLRLAPHARPAPRRPLRRLRRVRARLPGRHHPWRSSTASFSRSSYELYDYTVTDDPAVPAPIGAYATDDTQDFIK